MLGIREGAIQIFPSKLFFLTVPKNLLWEPFCVVFQKYSGIEKFMDGGGGIKIFASEFFYLTLPKIFQGESFSVLLVSVIEKC